MITSTTGSLNQQAVVDTVSALAEKRPDNFMFLDGNKDRCLVMWRSPQEWGSIIYNWVRSRLSPLRLSCIPPALAAVAAAGGRLIVQCGGH